MVEVFGAQGVSFVAVTQQFNTTTSMGRLTLNVLLSFAQFEREVTGERIRDKIAASKRKGIWMGGCPSIGYDVRDRSLVVNQAEAATVRQIYQRYLKNRLGPKAGRRLSTGTVSCRRSGFPGKELDQAARASRAARCTSYCRIRSTSARFVISASGIRDSMKRSRPKALGESSAAAAESRLSTDRTSIQTVTEYARWKGLRRNW